MEGLTVLSLAEQRDREQAVSIATDIPVQNLAVDMQGIVRAYLLNVRTNGFRVVVVEEWVEIDPHTFRDLKGE